MCSRSSLFPRFQVIILVREIWSLRKGPSNNLANTKLDLIKSNKEVLDWTKTFNNELNDIKVSLLNLEKLASSTAKVCASTSYKVDTVNSTINQIAEKQDQVIKLLQQILGNE